MIFKPYSKFLLAFFCGIFLVLQVIAQEVRDNFSSGTIFDIKKDHVGRIWIASDNGVYVSDGINFVQIPTGDYEITNSSIKSLELYQENVFLVYQNKGLVQLNINTLQYKKLSNQSIASILVEDNEHLFLALQNGTLESLDLSNKSKAKFKVLAQLGNDLESSSLITSYSKDYLILSKSNKGVFKINKHTGGIEKVFDFIPRGNNSMFARLGNRLFLTNDDRLFELNGNDEFVLSKYVRDNHNISYLIPLSSTDKVIVRSKKKIFLEKGDFSVEFNIPKTKNYEINNALYLSENNIIFGSNQGLIKVFNIANKTSSIYDSVIQMDDYVNIRRKIIPYGSNKIALFGYPKSHLYNFSSKQFKPLSNSINSLYDAIIINDKYFATSEVGGVKMGIIGSNKVQNIITKEIDTIRFYSAICNIGYLKKDHLLLGSRGSIILYDYEQNISKEIRLNNINAKVNALMVDSTSKLVYIATSEGLYFYDFQKSILVKKTNIIGNNIADFTLIKYPYKTILWYLSEKGLTGINVLNNIIEKHLSLNNFDNAKLTAILVDPYNRMWISSYKGIFEYEYPVDNVIKLNSRNGLVNQEFNYKSAAVLSNGQLIFGGLNGFDLVYTNMFKYTGKPIKGTILGYSIYGLNNRVYKHFDSKEIVQYNTDNYYLELYFSLQEFEKFKVTELSYQIDNMGWIPLQGLSYLYMYNLKDGLHTIKIKGKDDSGNPVIFDTIRVEQHTDFFKSANFRYFLFFIVIILMLVVGFIYYYNIQELNRVKVNIAMDLHDEIGTILNRTLFTIKDDPVLNKQTQLINYLSEALFSIRTYIKAFNIEKVSVLHLLDEIKEHANNYFKNTGIDYQISHEIDKEVYLSSYMYRDLKLIVYEVNQNILKHSKASLVKNNFTINGGYLIANIEDNGVLLNVAEIERKGNGITNIRKRISRLNGHVHFAINPIGNGLIIEIKLNLA